MAERRFFDSSRRSRAPAVGLVARRGTGVTAARRIKSTRRSRASWRLRAWVRWRWASITSTPSRVSLLPARRSSGARKLVDVLSARARGANEVLLELALGDADRRGDADHR